MALVGSVFRAMARLSPERQGKVANWVIGLGVDLGLRGERGPIFQNLMSLVPIRARPEDLEDRGGLMRMLNRQFRERLARDVDLGVFRLVSHFSRRPWQARWAIELFLRHAFSLWYAYFGSLDALGDRFGGAEIEDVFLAGSTWSPMGLTLLVNQFRGRLLFQATYVPGSVPEPLAENFLDEVLGDLVA
jgi:hypothetical protein